MKELWKNLKFTWKYAKDQKWKLIKYIICTCFAMSINIIIPILSAKIIIHLTDNNFHQLLLVAILIYVIENIRNILHYCKSYYFDKIYRETFTNIQTNLGREILKLENKCIDANNSGLFIQRLTNDTGRLAEIFRVITQCLSEVITNIGIFIAVFIINKIVFIYLLISVIILFIIEDTRARKYNEADKIFRKRGEKISGFVGEIVRGARDIKMLNAEDNFINELHVQAFNYNKEGYHMKKVNRNFNLLNGCWSDLNDLLLIVLLVSLIYNGKLSIASALIIHNYSIRIPNFIYYIGMLLDKVKDFNLSATRIFAIIDSNEFYKEKFGTKHLEKVEGNFEFKDVSFAYDEEKVLSHLSFKVCANETVAFVGKSGAGKSTIFSLLCKMYDVTDGKITIDGMDINELDKDSIRGNITVISQNPYIFNVSIRDNFRLVKNDMTEEEMMRACKLACLDEFIETLPDKYDTVIGEGGVNLSGGQKQRLAIARALIQKTEIILFDEATSALDNETQNKIQRAINNMQGEYTILMIAHRLSTIINSDRILFLKDGSIAAEGTHEQLLKNCSEYKKLYEAEIQKV